MNFQSLSNRKRLMALILTMVCAAMAVAGILGWGLYLTAVDEQEGWLLTLVQNRARVIEAVARFDAKNSQFDHPDGAWGSTMSQIDAAYETTSRFGDTGEFVLGQRDGDMIVFLSNHRQSEFGRPRPVPFDSTIATPMHLALMGRSGTVIGADYRNVTVLAAYEPVAEMNIGIVAKIDLAEIRAPFIKVGAFGSLGALLVIVLGGVLTHRIGLPLVKHLEATVASLREAQSIAALGSWKWNIQTGEVIWSDEQYRIYGYEPGAVTRTYQRFRDSIHPGDRDRVMAAVRDALDDKKPYDTEFRILRDNGDIRFIHAQAVVRRNAAGEPEGMVGTILDITESKQAEDTIKASLKEKEVLLQEIHHRVKNNLQVISSLLSLQAKSSQNPDVIDALLNSERRVRVMAQVHKNLYRSDDMARIDTRNYLESIAEDAKRSQMDGVKDIVFNQDIDQVSLGIDLAIPMGQIVSELLSNSLKHGFPNASSGTIDLSLKKRDGGAIELFVGDDGVGLPPNFDIAKSESLGLRLVDTLTTMIKGELTLNSRPGAGFRIVFKGDLS